MPNIIIRMEQKKEVITKQIEYYLGDKNLEKDDFFYTKIQESPDVLSVSFRDTSTSPIC